MRNKSPALILGFVAFVTSFGAHVVAVNLPVYAKEVGIGLAMIGLLIAVYDVAEIIAKPVFGFIADRKGMKTTMLTGIAIFCIASIAYLGIDPHLLIVVRFLQGLGAAALSIISAAMVAEYYTARRGEAFGIYNAIKGLGYVISPVIGGAIVWRSNFQMIFLASFAVGVLAFLLALLLPPLDSKAELKDDDDLSLAQFTTAFRDRTLLPWYAIIVINMFFVGILFGFLPVYIYSLGYDQLRNGLIIGSGTAAYLLIQPLSGKLADRFDPKKIIALGLILSAIGVLVISFAKGWALVAVTILSGAGVGIVWTNSDAMVSSLARSGQMAATLGAAGSFKELGDMLGPLMIGFLAQTFGIKTSFLACGIAGSLALLLLRIAEKAK